MEEKNTIPTTEGEAVTPEATVPDKPGPEPILTTEEAAILEHEGQAALFEMGEFVPYPDDVVVSVEKIEELIFTGSPPPVFHIESGGRDLLVFQMHGDLVAVLPADKQTENQTDNLGGFLVDYPKILVVRVFDIAVRGFCDEFIRSECHDCKAVFILAIPVWSIKKVPWRVLKEK